MLVPLPAVPPRLQLFAFAGVQVVVLLVAPLAIVRFGLRIAPAQVGLGLGDPRRWLREVAILFLVALPVLVLLSREPSIRAFYPSYAFAREQPWLLLPSSLAFAAYGLGWELVFRGLIQLGTRPVLGWGSVFAQLVPFVAAHAGKPPVEIALSVASGLVLGVLVHRHSTILPAWLLHWGAASTLNVLCLLG